MQAESSVPTTVLLVDDERSCYTAIRALLRSSASNLELHWCDTYDAALEALSDGGYDICLIDYGLHEQHTGIDLLRQIRTSENRVPVIMLTGRSDHKLDLEAMNAGADDYLIKGEFDARLLERSIRYAVERRRNEDALRLSQYELKKERDFVSSVLDTVANMVIVVDTEGRIVQFNPACEALTGYNADEVVGKDYREFLTPPEEREQIDEIFQELVAGELPRPNEGYWVTKGGDLCLISWLNTTLLDSDGQVQYVVGTGIDITERARLERERKQAEAALQESEQRFRNMADNAPVLIWLTNLEGCEFVNHEYLRFCGGTLDDILGMNWTQYLHPEDVERYFATYIEASTRYQEFNGDYRFLRGDGEYRWLRFRGVPRCTPDGSMLGYVGVSLDITEFIQYEQALLEARDQLEVRVAERTSELKQVVAQLEEAHVRQRRFVADASHDLRTPLTVIRGELDLILVRDQVDEQTGKSIKRALAGANRLESLANNLLLLARLDSGTHRAIFKSVRLDELLLESLSKLSTAAREKSIAWQLDFEESMEIVCDPPHMERALFNVLENALKYSSQNTTVQVMLAATETEVHITVADNGEGIPGEDLPNVFDSFFRSEMHRKTTGNGLGLAIVKSVIEAHDGYVSIQSELGVGTTVLLSLPKMRPQ
jgi:PAS domain S-box-containing protein